MNLSQLKQQIQNNLWYGEQRRTPDADRPLISSALIHPDYTKQFFIDISPWDGPAVQLGVTKSLGCQGVWIKGVDGSVNSRYFPENYATAVSVGLPRSSYAWLYRDVNVRATAQAQAFDTLLNRYPPSPELLPWIDFESTRYGGVQSNPDFTDLRKWLAEWLRLGNPKPIVYSGKYYMDQYGAMPSDVRAMVAGIAIANYSTLNPPLPLGFTGWIYHQFSAEGDAMAIAPNNVNKLELDLIYNHGTAIPPTVADGYQELRRNNSDCHIWRGRPAKVHVTNTHGTLETVSSAARRLGADIAINGDGWNLTGEPKHPLSLAASDGNFYQQQQYEFRPYLGVESDNTLFVGHQETSHYNTVSGTRYLVKVGVNAFAASIDPEHITERNPRTAAGYTSDGKLILCVVDGRSITSAGVTLKELAAIMLEAGTFYAIELDGGGSSAMAKGGVIVNEPSDGTERPVVNHLLVWTETENPMADYFEIVGNDGANHRVRTSYDVRSTYLLNANITNTVKAKAGATDFDVYVYAANVPDATIAGGFAAKAGDKWRKVYEVGGNPVSGWTAEIHLGVRQGITITPVTTTPPPPPPSTESASIDLELDPGTPYKVVVNGVVRAEGEA